MQLQLAGSSGVPLHSCSSGRGPRTDVLAVCIVNKKVKNATAPQLREWNYKVQKPQVRRVFSTLGYRGVGH